MSSQNLQNEFFCFPFSLSFVSMSLWLCFKSPVSIGEEESKGVTSLVKTAPSNPVQQKTA